MKCAIFSCPGLGDGLISLTLAHNLSLNGCLPTVFHRNKLVQLQPLFPHLPISESFPEGDILEQYDRIFIFYESSNAYCMRLIEEGKRKGGKVCVINASPSRLVGTQPFYADSRFDPALCMVENILLFCERILGLSKTERGCGIKLPKKVVKEAGRVIIHPFTARITRSWPLKKFEKLCALLERDGYHPALLGSPAEKKHHTELQTFENLADLAAFVSTADFMIGNDSGIGHLASALGLWTLSICRDHRIAKLWRPGFGRGDIIYASPYFPNLSIYRFRSKHWQSLISVKQVYNRLARRCTV